MQNLKTIGDGEELGHRGDMSTAGAHHEVMTAIESHNSAKASFTRCNATCLNHTRSFFALAHPIDALAHRSRFCENFRTVAHSGLLSKAARVILSTIYACKYFTKIPGIIEASYLNKYLKDGQISRERKVFGNRVHTTMSGVEYEVMRQTKHDVV